MEFSHHIVYTIQTQNIHYCSFTKGPVSALLLLGQTIGLNRYVPALDNTDIHDKML